MLVTGVISICFCGVVSSLQGLGNTYALCIHTADTAQNLISAMRMERYMICGCKQQRTANNIKTSNRNPVAQRTNWLSDGEWQTTYCVASWAKCTNFLTIFFHNTEVSGQSVDRENYSRLGTLTSYSTLVSVLHGVTWNEPTLLRFIFTSPTRTQNTACRNW